MSETLSPTFSVWAECRRHWRTYLLVCGVSVALSLVAFFSQPTQYAAQVKIADESKETDLLLGLSNMAAWLRGAMKINQGLDHPEVYASTVTGREFARSLGTVQLPGYGTDFYHYLLSHHREPWYERLWNSLTGNSDDANEQERVTTLTQQAIKTDVVPKYWTVTIQFTDSDPLVAAMMCDSVRTRLQSYLMDIRVQRAKTQLFHATARRELSEKKYREAQERYQAYADSHFDINSPLESNEEKALRQEYDAAFNTYNNDLLMQRRAEALVDKTTFSFAVLKNVTVPAKSSSPVLAGYLLSSFTIGVVLSTWIVLFRRKRAYLKQQGIWK